MKKDISIIILSAGKGTRMKSDIPKVLHQICGKPMLCYSIAEALKLSDDIHIVLYHQADKIRQTMDGYFDSSCLNYHIQDHSNYPGTGGAVMGFDTKHSQTLVLNGDMPLVDANELEKLIIHSDEVVKMSYLELEDATGYGRVVQKDGKVVKIVEQKDCDDKEVAITQANAGIYCFDTAFLKNSLPKLDNNNAQQEYYITDIVAIAIQEEQTIKAVKVCEDSFKGVNSKYDLAMAEKIMQESIKRNFMLSGVIMKLPDTIYIDSSVQIDGETILESGVSLLGETIITSSHIKTNTVIQDSVINDSDIGPMARVRPNCHIDQSHIGNFVEIKNSKLFDTKAGHLSYIGDSFVDSGANIGAGTITCNYDGIYKHKTYIGKNVFIGSGSQLIAPLSIADDCMIGAGSQVTKDTSSGDLVLNRAKSKTIKNYFYSFFGKSKKQQNTT